MLNDDADYYKEINERIEYERGVNAAACGSVREPPEFCKHRARWLEGYDVAKAAMPIST